MVKKTIEGTEYDIGEISYGEFMDIQDKHTVIDENTGKGRLLVGKSTRELILIMVKDSNGKAVDIRNKNQCNFTQGILLDKEVSKFFDANKVKNPSEEPEVNSQSTPIGKE